VAGPYGPPGPPGPPGKAYDGPIRGDFDIVSNISWQSVEEESC
jgi:hypothetical protein